jgi:hypothetical protein
MRLRAQAALATLLARIANVLDDLADWLDPVAYGQEIVYQATQRDRKQARKDSTS